MLNADGLTPLDYSIEKAVEANMEEQRLRLEGDEAKAEKLDDLEQLYTEKSQILIQRMLKFRNDSGIAYIKRPCKVALRFEKTFARAIQHNKNDVLALFPPMSIKSVYITMHSLKNYREF